MKNFLLLFLLSTTSYFSYAQPLLIDGDYNPVEMVEDFFNTDVVTVSNVTFTGNPLSIAFFESQGSELMVNAGLILSSGITHEASGDPGNFNSTSFGEDGDDDISFGVMGSSSFDASIIEFDILISEDTELDFKYVFGSEEYPEFVGSNFNDAFLFLIEGPGTVNGYPNGMNISNIPGLDIPVAINNVNFETNPEFYLDNLAGAHVAYDGLTTCLPAAFSAVANETYHVKIVVADVADGIFDSAVFLGYNSLGNNDSLVPPAIFTYSIIDNSNVVNFDNNSKYARDYQWDFGNNTSSDLRHPGDITYDANGFYDVTLITQNYCCSDTMSTTIEIAGLVDVVDLSERDIVVSPNPAKDKLYVDVQSINAPESYTLIDALGHRIISRDVNNGQFSIDVAGFAAGIYFVELSFKDGQRTINKFIKN